MSENTAFGVFAIMSGAVVLLGAPLMLEANARSVRNSRIFRGQGVGGHWATYNRIVIYAVGALAITAGVAALLGLVPE